MLVLFFRKATYFSFHESHFEVSEEGEVVFVIVVILKCFAVSLFGLVTKRHKLARSVRQHRRRRFVGLQTKTQE